MADLMRLLKPVLPADVERRLQEPPPAVVSELLAEPYTLAPEQVEHFREHGFGTEGLHRGDPLNKPSTPQLAYTG